MRVVLLVGGVWCLCCAFDLLFDFVVVVCVDLFSDEVSFLNWFVLIVLCCVICRWFGNWLLMADLVCCVFNSVALL